MDIGSVSNFLTHDSALQKEAFSYFENLKNDPNGWKVCLEALVNQQQQLNESRTFFCLLVIENYVKSNFETDAKENKDILRQFLFNWFTSSTLDSVYILNKYSTIVDLVFLVDFPGRRWNTFFHDFLILCQTQRHCELFLRILLQINLDVADREIPRTPKENERNNLIKDMMRETCLLELAQFWFNIINTYRDSSPRLVCLCLEVIGSYVAWIDISLITNDCIMTKLFSLFEKQEFRCAVCDCFNGILHKGMDPIAKAQLIEQFMNVDAIKEKLREMIGGLEVDRNEEFITKMAKLLNTIGLELVDAYKKIKPKQGNARSDAVVNEIDSVQQQLLFVGNVIESKFTLLCHFISDKNDLVSMQVHPFTREYIQWIKNNKVAKNQECLDPKTQEAVTMMVKAVITKSTLPLNYTFDSDDDSDSDECRKSCKVLFDNLMLLSPSSCASLICDNLIQPILSNWRNGNYSFTDVEISLYFFYVIGEHLTLVNDQKKIEDLLQLLVTSSISSFPHPVIQANYFELLIRYEKFFSSNLSFLIPQILVSFLDERGLKCSNKKLRSRVCQLFNKFIKCHVKSKANDRLQNFTEDILKRLQDFLKLDIVDVPNDTMVKKASIFDDVKYYINEEDQLVVFETVAILIVSNSNFDANKKHFLLKGILIEPLWVKFNETFNLIQNKLMSGMLALNNGLGNQVLLNGEAHRYEQDLIEVTLYCRKISHCISLVARTSKAFSNVHTVKSIAAQSIFLESFNNFVKALGLRVQEDNMCLIQSAIRQLLHRLIVCLDEAEIVPLLPVAIDNIFLPLSNLNFRNIQELVPLINQVVTKFKNSWMFQRDLMPFLRQMFVPLVSAIFSLTSGSELSADEVQSLQKCYFTFLSVLASNNVMEVFTSLESQVLEQVLMSLVQGAVHFPDITTQKSCFGVLKKLIDSQSGLVNAHISTLGDNKSPSSLHSSAFVEFVYKTVVPACFYAPIRQTEGDINQLLNECLSCLKTIQKVRGNEEFCGYMQNHLFPEHFATCANAGEIIQCFGNNEAKPLKVSFKQFIDQFKKASANS